MSIIDTVREAFKKAVHAGKIIKGEEGVDSYYYHIQEYEDETAAKAKFDQQLKKFLIIDDWTVLSDIENLTFSHYDGEGNRVNRNAEMGDFIKVNLPGPVPMYWVKINSLLVQPDKAEMVVQPTYDPTERPVKKEVTAHFFDSETRNKLNFERSTNRLIAEVRGVSAAVNNRGEEAGDTSIINTTVAIGGWAGLQQKQWNSFTKNLVGG